MIKKELPAWILFFPTILLCYALFCTLCPLSESLYSLSRFGLSFCSSQITIHAKKFLSATTLLKQFFNWWRVKNQELDFLSADRKMHVNMNPAGFIFISTNFHRTPSLYSKLGSRTSPARHQISVEEGYTHFLGNHTEPNENWITRPGLQESAMFPKAVRPCRATQLQMCKNSWNTGLCFLVLKKPKK